ncbi:CASP8 and FADD-like apoptosis regulator isoform X2 [Periophthalmus magnuspinnatus]|uniref:CASP8 and FADD-like apoptosis regulator isoform X2 n=2 Tax=Periophthalmus magnuspinnatus TaxID=409849 RepID=UPI00145BBBF9|nr:CASP8 and FADD-like apoptosis regulator isoform X2 [Periophthalmus magnuspinnatus]
MSALLLLQIPIVPDLMSNPAPPLPLLCQLVDSLSEPEQRTLVFLCGSLDSEHSPARTRNVLEEAVSSSESPNQVVRELLVQLKRLDLLRKLYQCGREEVERLRSTCQLCAYRVLMVNLSEDLTTEDLNRFKFLLGHMLHRDKLDRAKCFLDIIVELEKQDKALSERVDLIETCLRDIGRIDLAKRVRTLSPRVPEHTQAQRPWCPPPCPRPIQPFNCPPHTRPALNGRTLQLRQREASCSSYLEHYKLDTNPKGVCVIIDCVGQDGELLEQTFRDLHFSVVLYRWLSVSSCQSALRNLQQDLRLRTASAFVCCIISRGTPLHLLATDAQHTGLHLETLRRMFTPDNCPALTGKPKLFFIQSYSVPENQAGAGRSFIHGEDLETDGVTGLGQLLVPTDADVFWSHCWTQESQLQTTGHHSHYLGALMGALQTGRSHLVDLHLRVNAAVTEHNKRNPLEQYHLDLKHTLRKNLYLH